MKDAVFSLIVSTFCLFFFALAFSSSYFLWHNINRVDEFQETAQNIKVNELIKKISLPTKVNHKVGIDEAMIQSTLSGEMLWSTVYDSNGEELYSSNPGHSLCSDNLQSREIIYQGGKAGTLTLCLKEPETSHASVYFTMAAIWILLIGLCFGGWVFYGRLLTREVQGIEDYIKSLDVDKINRPIEIDVNNRKFLPLLNSIRTLTDRLNEVHKKEQEDLRNRAIKEREDLKNRAIAEKAQAIAAQAQAVAHDLKSPIGQIQTILTFFNGSGLQNKQLLRSALENIIGIVSDLNEQRANFDPEYGRKLTLNKMWEAKKLEYMTRDITFYNDIKWDSFNAKYDVLGFQRSLSNIVNNAVEAVDSGGMVLLSSYTKGSQVVIEVLDDGRGIDPAILSDIGHREVSGKPGGTGIGLLNTKKFLEKVKGTLSIDSSDKGTTVRMVFPVAS